MKRYDATPASDAGEEKNREAKAFETDEGNTVSDDRMISDEHVETTNNLEGSDGLDDEDPSLYEDDLRDK